MNFTGESTTPALDESEKSVGIISSEIQSNSLDVGLRTSQSVHNIVSGNKLIRPLLINCHVGFVMLFTERNDSRPEPAELRMYVRNHIQDKWEALADELGLDDDEKVSEELEKIKEKWKSDNQKAAFKLWLKHNKTTATWRKLKKKH